LPQHTTDVRIYIPQFEFQKFYKIARNFDLVGAAIVDLTLNSFFKPSCDVLGIIFSNAIEQGTCQ